MAHLARKQLVAFLSLFATRYIQEDPKHGSALDVSVITLSARRNPSDRVANDDAEVYFVSADEGARGGERSPNPIAVGGMNLCGQVFEGDERLNRQVP